MPLDKSAAALETGAAIAGISLRAGIEFLRATPAAAEILEAAELRSWGDLGRRLALGDAENAITFFAEGVAVRNDFHEYASAFSNSLRRSRSLKSQLDLSQLPALANR